MTSGKGVSMETRRCPRCGAPLPTGAYYEPLQAAPDRDPAYVVRHPLYDGAGRKVGTCVAYAGPEKGEARGGR